MAVLQTGVGTPEEHIVPIAFARPGGEHEGSVRMEGPAEHCSVNQMPEAVLLVVAARFRLLGWRTDEHGLIIGRNGVICSAAHAGALCEAMQIACTRWCEAIWI